MKKEMFEAVIANYNHVAAECKQFVDLFSRQPDLSKWTFEDLRKTITKASALQSKTDIILQIELYHLLGMGDLDAVQTTKLCRVIKTISSGRSFFKPFSCYALPPKLPDVPDTSAFTCKIAGVRLHAANVKLPLESEK